MSMEDYRWDLEENVEDAIVAYLKNSVTVASLVMPAREIQTASYPLIIVKAMGSENHTEDGRFTGRRVMPVAITIVTEALNRNGQTGSEAKNQTAREHHRTVKSSVIGFLAGNNVQDDVNKIGSIGVSFSEIFMKGQETDEGDGKLTTTQTLEVIAQPKEIE